MSRLVALLAVLALASAAFPQAAPPAPVVDPAPAPAISTTTQSALDLSDPRKTYESSMLAMIADDRDAALACITAVKPEFLPLAHAMTELQLARHHLGKVASGKFGELGLQFTGRTVASDAATRKLIESAKTAKLEFKDDLAALHLTEPIVFRKVKDQWKIDFSEAFTSLNLDAAEQTRIRDFILADIAILRAFAKRVEANEFPNVNAAHSAWKRANAASQPAATQK